MKTTMNMRHLFLVLVAALLFASAHKSASAQHRPLSIPPRLVAVEPSMVFTPQGFDDNDNAQAVLWGAYPNTCYRAAPPLVRVDAMTKTVYIRNQAYYYANTLCAEVMIPFTQTVNLGIMNTGNYQILVERPNGQFEPKAMLPVHVALSSAPDDFLYLPVTDAFVSYAHNGFARGVPVLTVRGTYTVDCMKVHEIKVLYRENNVIEVLPLAEMAAAPGTCHNVMNAFEETVALRPQLVGPKLIHVRALNGQAINKVFDFSL